MAHNINTYIGRQAAWHELGTVTAKYQTTAELLADPGFQYDVFKYPLFDGYGRQLDGAYGTFRINHKDRDAGNWEASTFLASVGSDYTVIPFEPSLAICDALMNAANGAHYETAGVLGKGEKVWFLVDVGLSANVGDDKQKCFLLFVTSFDGTTSHCFRICMTRVVCQNTLNIALGEKTRACVSVRHTKNAGQRIADMQFALESMASDVRRVEDKLNFLAGRKLNREAYDTIVDRIFPKRVQADDSDKPVNDTRRKNILADILKIHELNDGNAFPEQRDTPYHLLNSITNYTDHERSSKGDMRAESALFGSGDALKSKALEVIMQVAGGLPEVMTRKTFAPVFTGSTGSSLLDAVAAETANVA